MERQKLSLADTLNAAISGSIDVEYPNLAKIVRIFTSSTFTDTSVERNNLMETVYPRLKTYCQERGYEFQVVDMRWGVRDESTVDHKTSELCMRELRECQKLSTGPNFITFLGQKYGYRPFPPVIHAEDFDKMLGATEEQTDLDLLNKWWLKDENGSPQCNYLLQPITDLLPYYADVERSDEKTEARNTWWAEFERMQLILRAAADKVFSEETDRHLYYMSVTEDEITRGILNATDPDKHCHWFRRTITDMLENTSDKKAARFIDMLQGELDEEAKKLLDRLKEELIPAKLPEENITKYDVKWSENGIDPDASPEHKEYIDQFLRDFYDTLCKMIDAGIEEKEEVVDLKNESKLECIRHAVFAQEKAGHFHGRETLLEEIKEKILAQADAKKNYPLVIYGKTGSGKTALMAKLVELLPEWCDKKESPMVIRFIGTTMASTSTRQLLIGLCQQISIIRGEPVEDINEKSLKDLKEVLTSLLVSVSDSVEHLFILLDSLDQLGGSTGREMDWLKLPLPPNITMVMSSLPDEEFQAFPALQKRIKNEDLFVELLSLEKEDADVIVNHYLDSLGRTLTPPQMTLVKDAISACSYPLYLKLAIDEAILWKSYTPPDMTTLAETVPLVINALFDRLEKYHGQLLVSHALGYVTCSKSGLSEAELEDILSCDDEVLNDVYQYSIPPVRRLPPLLWVRIGYELREYLTDHGADGVQVINWYHRQFVEVATERYLADEAKKKWHTAIADYFIGKWSNGVKMPFVDKKGAEGEADRHVSSQPLAYKDSEDKASVVFNLRKMSELPYNLTMAEDWERLKREVFCNLEFLYQKLRSSGLISLLDDSDFVKKYSDDEDFALIHNALQFSATALAHDMKQLPTQLCARILTLGTDHSEFVQELIRQAQDPPHPCLVTVQGFLPLSATSGGTGGTLVKLAGHDAQARVVAVSESKTKIITYDFGGFVRMFDLESGRQLAEINRHEFDEMRGDPDHLILCHDDELLICSGRYQIDFTDVVEKVVKIPPIRDLDPEGTSNSTTPIVYHAENDWLLAMTCDELRVYNVTTGELIKGAAIGDNNPEPYHQGKEFFALQGSTVALLRATAKKLIVLDSKEWVETGAVLGEVEPVDDPMAMVVKSALLPDGRVACLYYKANCFEGPGTNPSKMKVFSKDGKLLNQEPFDLMTVPFAVGTEVLMAVGDDELLFSVFESDSSVFYGINAVTGESRKRLKYTGLAQIVTHIEGSKICAENASNTTVVDVIELPESADDSESDANKAAEEETNAANLVTNTFKEEVDAITVLPSTSRYAGLGGRNFQVFVWDLAEMKVLRELDNSDYGIYSSQDMMKYLTASSAVSVNGKNQLMGFDLKTLEEYGPHLPAFGGPPVDKNFAVVDSKTVIGPSAEQNLLKLVDFKTGKVSGTLKCKATEKIASVVVGANGQIALCAKKDGKSIIVWDLKKKSRLPNLTFKNCKFKLAAGTHVEVSGDGKSVVAKVDDEDSNIVVWDTTTGKATQPPRPEGEEGKLGEFAISRKMAAIVVGYNNGAIGIYDLKTLKLRTSFNIYEKSIDTMYAAEDGSLLAVITFMESNNVTVLDPIKEERIGSITLEAQIWRCQFTRDNNFMLLGGENIKGVVQFYIHRPNHKSDGKSEKPGSRAGKDDRKSRKSSAKSGKGSKDNLNPFEKAISLLKKKDAFYGEFKSRKLDPLPTET